MSIRDRRRMNLCLDCGRPYVKWPRFITQEFYEANRCPSGGGHMYDSSRNQDLARARLSPLGGGPNPWATG